MTPVTLNVPDEIKALGDSIGALIGDIKAKKPATQIAADVLPGVIAAVSSYQSLAADVKNVDGQVYLARCLAQALEG